MYSELLTKNKYTEAWKGHHFVNM